MRKGGKTARIYSLAVDPRAWPARRRARIAARLRALRARATAAIALRLEVRYDNAPAIALYEKLGYREFGRYPGYYADGAEALRFEKRLAPAPTAPDATAEKNSATEAARAGCVRRAQPHVVPAHSGRELRPRAPTRPSSLRSRGADDPARIDLHASARIAPGRRASMTGWVILVDQARDFPNAETPHKVITTSEYLARPKLFAGPGRPKIINLSRSYNYQSKGYYASLLAEARGHRIIPTVETMLELREQKLYEQSLPDLAGGAERRRASRARQRGRRRSICCSASA